jgi:divalent metal cation (Fe/Co/Zn/Cd) transporter
MLPAKALLCFMYICEQCNTIVATSERSRGAISYFLCPAGHKVVERWSFLRSFLLMFFGCFLVLSGFGAFYFFVRPRQPWTSLITLLDIFFAVALLIVAFRSLTSGSRLAHLARPASDLRQREYGTGFGILAVLCTLVSTVLMLKIR